MNSDVELEDPYVDSVICEHCGVLNHLMFHLPQRCESCDNMMNDNIWDDDSPITDEEEKQFIGALIL